MTGHPERSEGRVSACDPISDQSPTLSLA
jgi:hypothetical protein